MKYLKMLGLATAASALMALSTGVGTSSATVLCKVAETHCTLEHQYFVGTKITATSESYTETGLEWRPKITNDFEDIECVKSSIAGKTSLSGPAESIPVSVETLTFEECNCEVKVLKAGSLQITNITFTYNGTLRSSGAEITATCSTIFGNVHCIYVTESTDLGTLTSGSSPTLDVSSAGIPRLSTNALCDSSANLDGKYLISPQPLFVGVG